MDDLLSSLPGTDGNPQSLNGLLDLALEETGVDIRLIDDVVAFADTAQPTDLDTGGVIVRGRFAEDELLANLEKATGESLAPPSTTTTGSTPMGAGRSPSAF